MNKPQALNAFLFPSTDPKTMGSVETPAVLRLVRPATLAVWLIVFCIELQTLVSTGTLRHWFVLVLSTGLFIAAHMQFWYEESEQGRRFHRTLEKMRGRIYEDEETGLPNSRHFVFELRRQMMRSVRNGRGFSLLLTDVSGFERMTVDGDRVSSTMARALRHALGEGDFVARLQGPVFAAVVFDEREQTAGDKSDAALAAMRGCIPRESAAGVSPVVSITGYEGEIEVRDFLRRAQRDLLAARSQDLTAGRRQQGQQRAASPA